MSERGASVGTIDLPPAEALGAEIMARTDQLASYSEDGPGVTRRYASPQHRQAADQILSWMRNAGMTARLDEVGNVVGRYEAITPGAPALLLGSHQDTVRQGGAYDGMLGLITPISCIKVLNETGVRLPYAIESIAFADEEGLRFQTTLLGSRAVAGTFDPSILTVRDDDGVSMGDAMRAFGLNPEGIRNAARSPEDVAAFVELHIEQGPVLEARGVPVGVVSAIAGCTRLSLTLKGEAGHAGTVPMGQRRDALVGAAEAVLAIEHVCREEKEVVGTVGRIRAEPGAINVIPNCARFTLDLRAPQDSVRNRVLEALQQELRAIANRRGLEYEQSLSYQQDACTCSPGIRKGLEAAILAEGLESVTLFSGANHDAMAMADLAPIGMLFLRCKAGISHNPLESIDAVDAGIGARVLLRYMLNFGAE